MASTLSTLSASVTRILSLTGFPKELRTKDIQSAFSDWENANGGFKIKWKDDTSLFIVFQDATVGEGFVFQLPPRMKKADSFLAKRAYLHTIAFPPPILSTPNGTTASIRPYDGPDAQAVIQTVNARSQGSNLARHNMRSASVSTFANGGHGRDRASSSSNNAASGGSSSGFYRNGREASLHLQMASTGSTSSIPEHSNGGGYTSSSGAAREPSPTLPTLPSHPTLNALINSSLSEVVTHDAPTDPAIVSTSMDNQPSMGGPRIGDPGKRMLGAALGVRHPGLGPRMNGNTGPDPSLRDVQRGLGALAVSE
jgi:hypothetical protein